MSDRMAEASESTHVLKKPVFAPPALEIAVQILTNGTEKTLEERKGSVILDGRHH